MKLCVVGSRYYKHYDFMKKQLDKIKGIKLIISGGADGADTLAERYADENNIPKRIFIAEWTKYRRNAGPIRNKIMLKEGRPDLVVAFNARGPGTQDCIMQARKFGIPIKVFK